MKMPHMKMKPMNKWWGVLLTLLILALQPGPLWAHDAVHHSTEIPELVRFDQRLNEQVPLDLSLRDEDGEAVTLGQLLGDKPVILALSYFECESLCPLVRHGLVEALQPLGFVAGDEFDVVLVSIDPTERVENARRVKEETVAEYGRANSAAGWHLLTGEHEAIDTLADAIGFRYAYDGELDEYAHPSGVVVLTPEGKIARYFFGIEYAPQDLRLGLVEASQNKIGSPIDQLLLLCYHYDPTVGTYSLMIMNVLRMAGVVTVAGIALLIVVMWRKDTQPPAQRLT